MSIQKRLVFMRLQHPSCKNFKSLFQNLNYDYLPKFLDTDKTRELIRFELENKELNDYFLYSIINLAFAKNIND